MSLEISLHAMLLHVITIIYQYLLPMAGPKASPFTRSKAEAKSTKSLKIFMNQVAWDKSVQ